VSGKDDRRQIVEFGSGKAEVGIIRLQIENAEGKESSA